MVSGLAIPIWMEVGAALTNMDQNKGETSVNNEGTAHSNRLNFLY